MTYLFLYTHYETPENRKLGPGNKSSNSGASANKTQHNTIAQSQNSTHPEHSRVSVWRSEPILGTEVQVEAMVLVGHHQAVGVHRAVVQTNKKRVRTRIHGVQP